MIAPFPPRCRSCFTPVSRLASGGYGEVWVALQAGLERKVAVKVLAEHILTRADDVARFAEEARITASLSSPSIVVVHDHDIEDGVPWIAYELLPGPALDRLLATEKRLSIAAAVQVAVQVAAALEVAHAAGVVHRDVKPGNVIFAGGDRVKLADFGIAKWTGGQVKTATGVFLGSPAYLAPETITTAAAGPAGDLYSLGIMLFECITGRPPFVSDSLAQLLRMHVAAPPPLHELEATAPTALVDLVRSLLAKEPDQRPASAGRVREALEMIASAATPDPSSPGTVTAAVTTAPTGARRARGWVIAFVFVAVAGTVFRFQSATPHPVDLSSSTSGQQAESPPAPADPVDEELRRLDGSADQLRRSILACEKDLDPTRLVTLNPELQRLVSDLDAVAPLVLRRPLRTDRELELLKIMRHLLLEDRTEGVDPDKRVQELLTRWHRDFPDSCVPRELLALRVRRKDLIFDELELRRQSVDVFEADHLLANQVPKTSELELLSAIAAGLVEFHARHMLRRPQVQVAQLYGRILQRVRWPADEESAALRRRSESALDSGDGPPLAPYVRDPGGPAPDWAADALQVEAQLKRQSETDAKRANKRAFRWCALTAVLERGAPRSIPHGLASMAAEYVSTRLERYRSKLREGSEIGHAAGADLELNSIASDLERLAPIKAALKPGTLEALAAGVASLR